MSNRLLLAASAVCGLAITVSPALVPAALASPRTDAQGLVNQSRAVVRKLEADPRARQLLHRAKGVFIIPDYGKGGLIIGGRGGEGVVLAHLNGRWSDPAFYGVGGVTIGAQAGGEGGAVVLMLMSQNALNDVMGGNNFSLDAKSGLTIVNYSGKTQASWGRADVVIWSNAKGAYAGATVGISDVGQNQGLDRAYYNRRVTVNQILDGKVSNPGATALDHVLHES